MLLMAYTEEEEEDNDEVATDLMLMTQSEAQETARKTSWFLDSGCSNHMSGNCDLFSTMDEKFRHSVKLGNNKKMEVVGKGNVKIVLRNTAYTICDVFHIPELKNNLLSLGQLQENNISIIIQKGMCKIYHDERGLLAESKMSINRLFILIDQTSDAERSKQRCFQTVTEEVPKLWHERYGHLSHRGMKTLQNKDMVRGLPAFDVQNFTCSDCLVGKQPRNPIPKKSTWRAKEILELLHSDICGPISHVSPSGKRYILCFINDYSRKAWAYLLSEKSEAFTQFKMFKKKVENETGKSIKCLRTDRGGEYTSREFSDYCKEEGIRRQLTTAYTPQQNGIAERKNRTVMNMVRSLLSAKKAPKYFWSEAANWTFYVLNRCPTSAVKNITPQEAWNGVKPSVEHFRVWGSIGHVHVPDVKRRKLDDKSMACVLVGFSEESKAYRLYNQTMKKMIVSRDVVFEENKGWNWEKEKDHQPESVLTWNDDDVSWEESDEEGSDTEAPVAAPEQNVEPEQPVEEAGELHNEQVVQTREGRRTRRPRYLNDYVTEGADMDDEDEVHMANMVEFNSTDPSTFEEAEKSLKWREAMDVEMNSIMRNYQTYQKKLRVLA